LNKFVEFKANPNLSQSRFKQALTATKLLHDAHPAVYVAIPL